MVHSYMTYSPLGEAKSYSAKPEILHNRGEKKESQIWTSETYYFRGTFSTIVQTLLNLHNRYVLEDVAPKSNFVQVRTE